MLIFGNVLCLMAGIVDVGHVSTVSKDVEREMSR